jgi:hypothetical protein
MIKRAATYNKLIRQISWWSNELEHVNMYYNHINSNVSTEITGEDLMRRWLIFSYVRWIIRVNLYWLYIPLSWEPGANSDPWWWCTAGGGAGGSWELRLVTPAGLMAGSASGCGTTTDTAGHGSASAESSIKSDRLYATIGCDMWDEIVRGFVAKLLVDIAWAESPAVAAVVVVGTIVLSAAAGAAAEGE